MLFLFVRFCLCDFSLITDSCSFQERILLNLWFQFLCASWILNDQLSIHEAYVSGKGVDVRLLNIYSKAKWLLSLFNEVLSTMHKLVQIAKQITSCYCYLTIWKHGFLLLYRGPTLIIIIAIRLILILIIGISGWLAHCFRFFYLFL